jgi:hypothetical protein
MMTICSACVFAESMLSTFAEFMRSYELLTLVHHCCWLNKQVFGMNLKSEVEEAPHMFWLVTGGIFAW